MCRKYRRSLAHQTSLLLNQGIPMGAYGIGVISFSDASNRRTASADFSQPRERDAAFA